MRVILKTEVKGLGRVGDVKDVADGYARNYLLPKGLAIEATGAELRQLAQERDAEKAKKDRTHGDAEALAKRIAEITLVFKLKAGDQGKTFGSVTATEVAEALTNEAKTEIDRTKVALRQPLKQIGVHPLELRLLPYGR